jgi:hypothetical protein
MITIVVQVYKENTLIAETPFLVQVDYKYFKTYVIPIMDDDIILTGYKIEPYAKKINKIEGEHEKTNNKNPSTPDTNIPKL